MSNIELDYPIQSIDSAKLKMIYKEEKLVGYALRANEGYGLTELDNDEIVATSILVSAENLENLDSYKAILISDIPQDENEKLDK